MYFIIVIPLDDDGDDFFDEAGFLVGLLLDNGVVLIMLLLFGVPRCGVLAERREEADAAAAAEDLSGDSSGDDLSELLRLNRVVIVTESVLYDVGVSSRKAFFLHGYFFGFWGLLLLVAYF